MWIFKNKVSLCRPSWPGTYTDPTPQTLQHMIKGMHHHTSAYGDSLLYIMHGAFSVPGLFSSIMRKLVFGILSNPASDAFPSLGNFLCYILSAPTPPLPEAVYALSVWFSRICGSEVYRLSLIPWPGFHWPLRILLL